MELGCLRNFKTLHTTLKDAHKMKLIYLKVVTDVLKYLKLGDTEMWVSVIRMTAGMDNAVHIQVKVVEFWNLK